MFPWECALHLTALLVVLVQQHQQQRGAARGTDAHARGSKAVSIEARSSWEVLETISFINMVKATGAIPEEAETLSVDFLSLFWSQDERQSPPAGACGLMVLRVVY